MLHECRKAARAASKWWTTLFASTDTAGELLRAKRGDESEEGISDRPRPSPSRGPVKAISILRASRKLSCEGGSVTRRVTGCQRRSRERSEITSSTGEIPAAREGEYPSSLPHGPPKRVQRVVKRRTHRSHRTTLKTSSRTKQGRKPRARVQVQEAEWLAEVGRTHRDTGVRARVPSPREIVVGVDARDGTSEGESVCRFLRGIFYRTPQRIHRVRESVRGPFTTEGVLNRSNVRSSPGVH